MMGEKALLELLQTEERIVALGMKAWFEEAPEDAAEPMMVLQSIRGDQELEIGLASFEVQVDVYSPDRFTAVEKADALVGILHHASFTVSGMFMTGFAARRTAPLKVEDGTWKVPVEIRFLVKERRGAR